MQDMKSFTTLLSSAGAVVAGGLAAKLVVSIGSAALGSDVGSAVLAQVAGVSAAFFLGGILTGVILRNGGRTALSKAVLTPGLWWVLVLMLDHEGRSMALVFGAPVFLASLSGVIVGSRLRRRGEAVGNVEVSHLHRSRDWGGQPHVDLYLRDETGRIVDRDDGHSPTIHQPPRDGNAIKLPCEKDLPPPYGDV